MSLLSGKHRVRKILLYSALALGVLSAGLYGMRFEIAENVGLRILHTSGFDSAAFTVKHIGFNEVRISDVSLDEKIKISDLSIGYTLHSLYAGKIDWISVNGMFADISSPSEGALKTLLSLRKSGGAQKQGAEKSPIPSINVSNGVIVGVFGPRELHSELSFELDSNYNIVGEVRSRGRVETAAGPILIEDLILSIEANLSNQTGSLILKNGQVRHGAEKPDWIPLNVVGNAEVSEQKLNFVTTIGLGADTPLFRMEGVHDLKQNSGAMDVDIQDVAFDKAGLQPSNITSSLEFIPPIDALISSQSTVSWVQNILSVNSVIFAKDTKIIGPDVSVESDLINVKVNGFFDLATGDHQAQLSTEDLTALVAQGSRKYAIDELSAAVDIKQFGQEITLNNLLVSLRHVSLKPDFVPVIVRATGLSDNATLLFQGSIKDEKERLKIPFNGQHDLSSGEGFIEGAIESVKFSRNGLQPGDLSGLLTNLPGKMAGHLEISARANWNEEHGITIPSLSGRFREGAFSNKDVGLYNLNLSFDAHDIEVNKPFAVNISKIWGGLVGNGRHASLKNTSAKIELKKGWKDFDIVLEKATLVPGKGALLKPEITVQGRSTIRDQIVNFEGHADTDYLGSFAEWGGTHDLKTGIGDVIVRYLPIEFEEGGVQLSDLIDVPDPTIIVTGTLSSEQQMNWEKSGVKRTATLSIDGVGIKTKDVVIQGLNGEIKIDELIPLTISAQQELSAEKIISAITIEQPALRFRVLTDKEDPVLYVDELKIGVVGGNATIKDAVLNTGSQTNEILVQLSNIDLEKLMALSDVEDMTASGTLNGEIPIVFDGETLLIDVGFLETSGPGILQLKSTQARNALAVGGDQTKLLFDILENFQYSELSVEIKKLASGEDTVLLHTKGVNPDVENSRPVILNINLTTDLDKIFKTLLDGYRLSEKALRATVGGRQK